MKLIMSSSPIQSVRIPVVLLTLTLKTGDKTNSIVLQLSKRELNQLVESLTNVQKVVKALDRGMKEQ